MAILKTWPYGTQRYGFVAMNNFRPFGLDPKASTAQLIVDDVGEAHICVGGAGDATAERGDSGVLSFTKGGPTGGYWKFTKDGAFNIADEFNPDFIPKLLSSFKNSHEQTLADFERDYPFIKWREPFPASYNNGPQHLACRICIAQRGMKGSDIPHLPKTREEFAEHMRTAHRINL
jgi:hypothetical protein